MLHVSSKKTSQSLYQKFHAYLITCCDIPIQVQKTSISKECGKYGINCEDVEFITIGKFLYEVDFARNNTGIIIAKRFLVASTENEILAVFDICDKKRNCSIFIIEELTLGYDIPHYINKMFSNNFEGMVNYLRETEMYIYINHSNIATMTRDKRGILRKMINEGILEEFLTSPEKIDCLEEESKTELLKMSKGEPFDDSKIDLQFLAEYFNVKLGPIKLDRQTQVF